MDLAVPAIDPFVQSFARSISDQGKGRPFLLLHGGGGPESMAAFAASLSSAGRVIAPTHPGFAGTSRPEWCASIGDLVRLYLALLDRLDLDDVVVIGNSIGGWIACEMALRASPRITAIVLLNAVGIEPGTPGWAMVNPAELTPEERAARAFFNPGKFAMAPSGPAAAATTATNYAALKRYAGKPFMVDPSLRARLAAISVPTLVLWGEADLFVDVEYGRIYAKSIPEARFEAIPEAGHFPQIEQRDKVQKKILEWLALL
jgi:pimeloyl-ACP methyl ester carboxylesterase